jgi:uncharacterized membrane protein YbhN (UPF0104 family)
MSDATSSKATDSGAMPAELSSRRLVRGLLELAVLVAVIAIGVGSLPGLGALRARFAAADGWFLALVCLLKLCSCLSNVVAFRDVFCGRMGWRFSYELGMAEQGTNVLVPTGGIGGLALGAWALRQGGMSTEHIARRSVAFFVLTSLPNFACAAVVGPLLLIGVFPGDAPTVPTAVFTGMAWGVMLLTAALPVLLRRFRSAERRGKIVGRLRAAASSLADGIRDTGKLLATGRWQAILGAIGYLGFDIAALAAGYAAFGNGLPVGPLIFAYVIGQLGGLIPLPAGIGGTDLGLIGALVLYGSPLSQAAAAVLAYRLFQLGVPAVLGTIAFVRLRHRLAISNLPAVECAGMAEVVTESG